MFLFEVYNTCDCDHILCLPDLVDGQAGVVPEVLPPQVAQDEGELVATVLLHLALVVRPQLLALEIPNDLKGQS